MKKRRMSGRICASDPGNPQLYGVKIPTVANVHKTFEILEKQGVHTITIVTSLYHQKRSQALYGVMARIYRQERNYAVRSVGNFCYEKTDAPNSTPDDRLAIQGMVELLRLPEEAALPAAPSGAETDQTADP